MQKFLQAITNDPATHASASQAAAFLKGHLDSVEKSELPEGKHQDYGVRMMLPLLDGPGWVRSGMTYKWDADQHVIEISDSGGIVITQKNGAQWFKRP
ncbi:hypothetical protein EX530_04490 [Xanthomonas phaseoli]|uniref:hypothetical protein n=1 Tax=Xanthomonas phaseoli TaxID=1985254 RepID=UPI003B00448E